ncbi:MAG: hypothetical protein F6K39_33990 [Okeania sp. SIO3B3]|nr:hypothetical protein [Okeania sp. SIO3B3]
MVSSPSYQSQMKRSQERRARLVERSMNGDEKASELLKKRDRADLAVVGGSVVVGAGAAILGAPFLPFAAGALIIGNSVNPYNW